jgi:hypothetical protein
MLGNMLIAAYVGLVCLQSCMRVDVLMHRDRERERDGAAIGGRKRACRRRCCWAANVCGVRLY